MPTDPYQHAREEIAKALLQACHVSGYAVQKPGVLQSMEEARPEFGDIASTIAFGIAKGMKRNPKEIAVELARHLEDHELIERCEVVGPYLNFRLSPAFLKYAIDSAVEQHAAYGSRDPNNKAVYVEFPSVNPNKPWHVGHLRNAILGDSVARLLSFTGFDVRRLDLINDLGLQVAQSVWGYMNLGDKIDMKADQWLGRQYVEVAKKLSDPEVERQVREVLKRMEEGDPLSAGAERGPFPEGKVGGEIARIGRELCETCVKAQYETAFRLGVYHDLLIWESDLMRAGAVDRAIEKARASGAVHEEKEGKNAGCLVAGLSEYTEFANLESPDKVLIRSDGTATYTLKDLALQMWKYGLIEAELKFSEFMKQPNGQLLQTSSKSGSSARLPPASVVINVIGVEQKYPQRILSLILESTGHMEQAKNSVHLAYEHAWLPDKKFSGREGSWIGYSADEVIDEAEARALAEIRTRFADMDEKEKEKIARSVGVGAVRFGMLRTTPEKKLVFTWEEALNFEGDSAPYIQYSHARCSRILERAGGLEAGNAGALTAPEERALAVHIARFPSTISHAALDMRPHIVADYLLHLATYFSKFYSACPVLKADEDLKRARLRLVKATQIVLHNGLGLLGIDAPERM